MIHPASPDLLAADEPAAFEVAGREGRSPFVVSPFVASPFVASPFVVACDHAGRDIPRSLGSLGLSEEVRASHVAWDIGAGGVARRLGAALGAVVVSQRYSRLVIDCNRPLDAPDSIAARSERVVIPGNQNVGQAEATARARAVFHPYHDAIRAELAARREAGRTSIYVAVHSFTPVYLDVARPWHVGVLYNRDARLAEPLLGLLRSEGDLVVGCNEPYAVSDATDFSVVNHGEQRGIPHVELEIRQDLVADDAGQIAWAARLARLLVAAAQSISTQNTSQK